MDIVDISPSMFNRLPHRHLIDDQLWNRLVSRIVKNEAMEVSLAERIMDQTVAYLLLCARNPTERYGPSALVDVGWHTFILYTREYAAFCNEIAGRFIHHCPSDYPDVDDEADDVRTTVAALKQHSLFVDEALWSGTPACSDGVSCANNCRGNCSN